tara:strand:+ start:283 stop:1359 length:1077 start_codon:yes stop_codon:yes gene_type:complete
MKKILFVIPDLLIGGAEKNLLNISRHLSKKNVVEIITFKKINKVLNKEINKNIKIIKFNSNFSIITLIKLIRFLKKNNYDKVISFLNIANVLCLICCFFIKKKISLNISLRNNLSNQFNLSTKDKIIIYLIKLFINNCEKIICVSNFVAKDAIENFSLPLEKVVTIYNPVVNSLFIKRTKEKLKNKYIKKLTNKNFICCVGSLTVQKDFITVIKSFNIIKDDIDHNLIIIGKGCQHQYLKNYIYSKNLQKRVFLLGEIENPLPLISKSSLFISSSLWEGLPSVLIEAAYFNKHIIASKCPGGSNEILKLYGNHSYYRPRDFKQLSKIILKNKNKISSKTKNKKILKIFSENKSLNYIK